MRNIVRNDCIYTIMWFKNQLYRHSILIALSQTHYLHKNPPDSSVIE